MRRGTSSGENCLHRTGLSLGAWIVFRIFQSKMSEQDVGVGGVSRLRMVGEMVPRLLPLSCFHKNRPCDKDLGENGFFER